MGQVQWQRSRSASRRANRRPPGRLRPLWDVGLIRHRCDGNSVDGAADRQSCPGDQNVLCFHWLPPQGPAPILIAAARCGAMSASNCADRQASARTREWMARRHRARRPYTRPAVNFARENWRGRATAAASEWMTQVPAERPPTPFERGMPPRRRGRIPGTSGESIFQRIALTRTFYARCQRRRSRHAGLPPESSAAALKTAPTTL